ncbi:MAG: PLP-dependent aminotransferase family protein [Solirubrobacteraceae bacterium]
MSRVLDDLRARAAAGLPGERLPSVRQLAAQHRASPLTVQRALTQLAAEGLVIPRPGRGTFVAPRAVGTAAGAAADLDWQSVALGPPTVDPGGLEELLAVPGEGRLVLSSGFVDASLQPLGELARAAVRAARRAGAWDRGPVEGDLELRAWFAREIGAGHTVRDVVVTNGGQSALATAFRALGRPGETVLVESPTYLGGLAAARSAGLIPFPVPVDEHGVRPELFAEAMARTRARLAMLQPRYANPSGALLSASRRGEVMEAVRAADAFVIEDDWARDLAIDGPTPPPLAADDDTGHVVYVRSLTKSAAPGLRVGAVVARGPAAARLRAARVVDDFFVSGILQHTALELLSGPAWTRHRRDVATQLAVRRDVLLAELSRQLPHWRVFLKPRGGLHVWVRLPGESDEASLVRDAAAAGIHVNPGRPWFASEPPAPHLRLTFAAASPAELREAVARLARLPSALPSRTSTPTT